MYPCRTGYVGLEGHNVKPLPMPQASVYHFVLKNAYLASTCPAEMALGQVAVDHRNDTADIQGGVVLGSHG